MYDEKHLDELRKKFLGKNKKNPKDQLRVTTDRNGKTIVIDGEGNAIGAQG